VKKYSDFQNGQIRRISHPVSFLPKGRLAIVTDAERDAVDVEAPLTNGAEADGKVVWSRRLEVGVKPVELFIRRRRCQENPITGESTK